MIKKVLLAGFLVAALLGISEAARATPLVQVVTTDYFYGPFSGSLQSGATGSADVLTWQSAGYYTTFQLDFTNAAGTVTDVLSTADNDTYVFDGFLSGNAAIGTTCQAGGTIACLTTTGQFQDLTSIVNAFNGGDGIYEGGDISIKINDAVPAPEPASLFLFGTGLIGIELIRRRRSNSAVVRHQS